jgi:SAM-dependent methyltransferase
MSLSSFCCPVCKGTLEGTMTSGFRCMPCDRDYPIVDGVPDFFVTGNQQDYIDEPNKTWLDPEIVRARDTMYRLSTRELKGMAFCMQEIGCRTCAGCRILEVGMGTGHFTRWLAEVASPEAEIYSFDLSWPIIEVAKEYTRGLPGIVLLRANARGRLPFQDATFDIVFIRLAPLGAHGVPNAQAAFELLKPGGWLFEAGAKPEQYETPPTDWAIQHGFAHAEHHVWQYRRTVTEQERIAAGIQRERMASLGIKSAQEVVAAQPDAAGNTLEMTYENLLIAHKPA